MVRKLIVISGLPGSGKSTVAEAVARELKLSLFSLDPIKASIIKSGLAKSFENGHAAWLVAVGLADEQLKLDNSVVIDAINAEEAAKDSWRELATKRDAELIVVECFTSDRALHKKRIANRVRNLHGIPEVTWEWVENRRKAYTQWREPVLALDTRDDLRANVEKAIAYIQQANLDNRLGKPV